MSIVGIQDDQIEWLHKVLLCVRTKHKLVYTRFIEGTGINYNDIIRFNARRWRPTREFYDSVIQQAQTLRMLPADDEKNIEYNLLDVVQAELSLDDKRMAAYSERYAGQYTYFLRTADDVVTVSDMTLIRYGLSVLLPNFTIWRQDTPDDIFFKGYYYDDKESLYLVGNQDSTSLPRLIIITRRYVNTFWYFEGMSFGATLNDEFIFMPCVAIRADMEAKLNIRHLETGVYSLNRIAEVSEIIHSHLSSRHPDRRSRTVRSIDG